MRFETANFFSVYCTKLKALTKTHILKLNRFSFKFKLKERKEKLLYNTSKVFYIRALADVHTIINFTTIVKVVAWEPMN